MATLEGKHAIEFIRRMRKIEKGPISKEDKNIIKIINDLKVSGVLK